MQDKGGMGCTFPGFEKLSFSVDMSIQQRTPGKVPDEARP